MKKKIFFLFSVVIILFGSCSDPIFYAVSLEEKILEPLIKGSPTNFVEFNSKMYVASGSNVWCYNGGWSSSNAGGKVLQLAADLSNLYALIESGEIKQSSDGTNWGDSGYPNASTIYSDNNVLFIGTGKQGGACYITVNSNTISTGDKLLKGAAVSGSDYYVSLIDGGINKISSGNLSLVIPGSFMGIITIGSNVYAISRDGKLYAVKTGKTIASLPDNYLATGALAVWSDGTNSLLLAGRQDILSPSFTTGYTYGYLEIPANSTGVTEGSFTEPGKNLVTTVGYNENERYSSTIGKYPVNHIFRAQDGTLFASTQTKGVWSLRVRKGILIWNAEN